MSPWCHYEFVKEQALNVSIQIGDFPLGAKGTNTEPLHLVAVTASGLQIHPVSPEFTDRYPLAFTEWVAQRVAAFDHGESLGYVWTGSNPQRFVPRKPVQYRQDATQAVLFAVVSGTSARLYILACVVDSTMRYVVFVERPPWLTPVHEMQLRDIFPVHADFTNFVADALQSAEKTWGVPAAGGLLGTRGQFATTPVEATLPRVRHVRRRVAFPRLPPGRPRHPSASPVHNNRQSPFHAASVRFCAGHHRRGETAPERRIVGPR